MPEPELPLPLPPPPSPTGPPQETSPAPANVAKAEEPVAETAPPVAETAPTVAEEAPPVAEPRADACAKLERMSGLNGDEKVDSPSQVNVETKRKLQDVAQKPSSSLNDSVQKDEGSSTSDARLEKLLVSRLVLSNLFGNVRERVKNIYIYIFFFKL